jgi:hypothetical protein
MAAVSGAGGSLRESGRASRTRNAVIEFPLSGGGRLLEVARIPAGTKLWQPVSTADLIIIEGYDGPQPA